MKEEKRKEIVKVLSAYDLGEVVSVKYLTQGYANENLLVVTDQQKILYRICLQQPLALLEFEISLMREMKKSNLKAAYPVVDREGNAIQKPAEGLVMLYDFVEGTDPVLNIETAKAIGHEIGKLSLLNASELSKKNAIHMDNCFELIEKFERAKNSIPDVFEYFKEQTAYLKEKLNVELPTGIVHGDVFPNNTIFKGRELQAVIDFEEACEDHLMFDVGMTINGFCFIDNELDADFMKSFLRAYNQQRKMTPEEWKALPYFIQWGSHGMLSWHLKNDLINVENEIQHKRVLELMLRTQWLRANEDLIMKMYT